MNAVSNGIRKRQNEAANIAKLTAADTLYAEAKRLNFLKFLLSVMLPFLLSRFSFFIRAAHSLPPFPTPFPLFPWRCRSC